VLDASAVTSVVFLGTGNFLAPDRYWNSFVVGGRVLVEPAPTALPHLRRAGVDAGDLEAVLVSHFHPDHTFGWPFLLLEVLRRDRDRPLWVVGPPGVEAFLEELLELGGVPDILEAGRQADLRFVEVDGRWQDLGSVRVRGVEVDHVPHLRCFGFLLEVDGRVLGYSGDTRPCDGLDELAARGDALVLECNGPHPGPAIHMEVDDVRALRQRFPSVPFVLTHLGPDIDPTGIADVTVPEDFDTLEL
jgi:ribonuclease Z